MRIPLLDHLFRQKDDRPAAVPKGIRPVIDRDFPDPDVITEDGQFYAYSTNSSYDGRLVNVPVQRAEQLVGPWTMLGDAMPQLASWVADPAHGGPNVWAPEIAKAPGGGHLLYYTAHHASQQVQCIGVAASDTPSGPFRPVGADALVCHPEDGDTIDAESFTDVDGSRYLIYKSGRTSSTMWLQKLSADGLSTVGGRTELIRSDRPEEANIVEAPTMVLHDGTYVLFFSANTFNSGHYFVNYARAPRVGGPYTKQPGEFLTTDTIGRAFANTGHEDVVAGPDGDYLVFHASVSSTERAMFVIGLDWGPDGRPEIAPDRPPAVPATTPVKA
jgi:beta-xylosidase